MWGAALPRFMPEDFAKQANTSGVSPAWPYSYDDLEPHYETVDRLYGVHGSTDWGAPARRAPLLPAVGHEPAITRVVEAFRRQGLHPYDLPVGVDLGPGGRCIRCATCDGFPCQIDAKNDAEIAALRPALDSGSVELLTGTRVERLVCNGDGTRVARALASSADGEVEISAGRFVLSAGAVNSAALLLRSSGSGHPRGLANSSDLVGRNYMHHVTSAVMAVDPRRRNPTHFQKSFGINDWYSGDDEFAHPMGNVQGVNKIQPGMLAASRRGIPNPATRFLTSHSLDLWVQTEDLPEPENRATIQNGRIAIRYRKNNVEAHEALLGRVRKMLRRAGFPLVFIQRMGIATNSHQCGTCRAGTSPGDSVLDPLCRTHDVDNLWVVDSSFMPSSAALNPGLTIAANAVRVAQNAFLNTS
jgi:choline dehydrogenase-like flavoprotein